MYEHAPEKRIHGIAGKTVLVADDEFINRVLLQSALSSYYSVLLAKNGVEVLEILRTKKVDAVILDLSMPKLDGLGVLNEMRTEPSLSAIPVVAVTGAGEEETEQRALDLGAKDIIAKPFSRDVILRRIGNIFAQQDAVSAARQNRNKYDELTGLLTRRAFVVEAREFILNRRPGSYDVLCFDIDNFKVINDRFGHSEGDRLLKFIPQVLLEDIDRAGGIACRDSADTYIVLLPNDDSVSEPILTKLLAALKKYDLPISINVHIGKYIAEDVKTDINLMIDRALIALRSVKGSADTVVCTFNDEMREKLLLQQELIDDMRPALEKGQFIPYFQPQFNYALNEMTGAEALVRWNHPKKGLIPPVEFLPLFESNGFITQLDEYIWEQVCRHQKKWLDSGAKPIPVSVNISRRDIRALDLPKVFGRLIFKYGIPPELLHLEITESAYTEHPKELIGIVKELQAMGFSVEMDDFGSGYSSLNMLKDVPVDVLKLDMNFINDSAEHSRGGHILSAVVKMAEKLKLPVIAEGVENHRQADYLKSIGCHLMQGYLFNKPMPAEEFEALLFAKNKVSEQLEEKKPAAEASEQAAKIYKSFSGIDTKLENDIVSNLPAGIIIISARGEKHTCEYINSGFCKMLGYDYDELRPMFDKDISAAIYPDDIEKVHAAASKAVAEKAFFSCDYRLVRKDGEIIWVNLAGNPVSDENGALRFFCAYTDITNRIAAQNELRIEEEAFRIAAAHTNSRVCRYNIKTGTLLLSHDGTQSCGITHELKGMPGAIAKDNRIFCEDIPKLVAFFEAIAAGKDGETAEIRHVVEDGSLRWFRAEYTIIRSAEGEAVSAIVTFTDISTVKEKDAEITLLRENKQLLQIIARHSHKYLVIYEHATDTFKPYDSSVNSIPNLLPLYSCPADYISKGIVAPECLAEIRDCYAALKKGEPDISVRFKARALDGSWKWLSAVVSVIPDREGKPLYGIASFEDISDSYEKELAYHRYKSMLASSASEKEFFLDYDLTKNTLEGFSPNFTKYFNLSDAKKGFSKFINVLAGKYIYAPNRRSFRRFFSKEKLISAFSEGIYSDETEFQIKFPDSDALIYTKGVYRMITDPYSSDLRLMFSCEIIDDEKRAELELIDRAENDPVTRLLNRATFIKQVSAHLNSENGENICAFAMLDIDHFKNVNDELGHIEGDSVLRDVAETIQSVVFRGDIVGRLGGDEFGILFCRFPDYDTLENKLRILMTSVFRELEKNVKISASIGVAVFPKDGKTYDELYKMSDIALYNAKNNGRNQFVFYSGEMQGTERSTMLSPID